MMSTFDILGLGVVAVDDLVYVEAYPSPNAKVRVLDRERQCGGLTATALVAAARLGVRCAFGGTLGNDDLSQYAIQTLRREGIDLTFLQQTETARPAYSTIIIDESRQTRNIFVDLRQAVGVADDWPPVEVIQRCRALFVDHIGIVGAIRAARLARRMGIPVVADIESDSQQCSELVELVDHLILSQEFACQYTGLTDPAQLVNRFWRPDRSTVVITCGGAGCWYRTNGDDFDQAASHFPAFSVKVVDTTGCGDVFHGAYTAALVKGLTGLERIRFASAAAALKATRRGGQAGAPRLAALEEFLNRK